MTNADVIRQMTDEELYKFLQAIEVGDIDYSLTFCSLCKKDNQLDCDECFKRWLFNDAHDYNGLLKDKGINSGYADRKTENCSEKPNNCTDCECTDDCSECKEAEHGCKTEPLDKDINVRSKDEPQTEYKKWETPPKFEHKGIITTCVGVPMALIEDEPQTERSSE